MATANVEICRVARDEKSSGAVYGKCLRSQALTVSSSTATLTTALTAAEIDSGAIVRVSTDTACYVAVGAFPNPAATTETAATTAKMLLQAGTDLPFPVSPGDKVAVIAL